MVPYEPSSEIGYLSRASPVRQKADPIKDAKAFRFDETENFQETIWPASLGGSTPEFNSTELYCYNNVAKRCKYN